MCPKKILFFLYLSSGKELEGEVVSSLLHSTLLKRAFDCSFFDLSEKVGRWELMRRIVAVVESEQPDLCYFIPYIKNGITLRDYEVKMLLERMGKSPIIYFTGGRLQTFMSRLLRKTFFANQKVLITDWRDYQLICRYTSKKNVITCPKVDGFNITMEQFENRMIDILK